MLGFEPSNLADDLDQADPKLPNCKERWAIRRDRWIVSAVSYPCARHYVWWLVHNCIAHPLLGLIPIEPLHNFHDWTSKKLNRL